MVGMIVTDASRTPQRMLDDYTLDLAYGADENTFKLTCTPQPEAGSLVMIDGTEYGGLVTIRNTDGSVEGPTWHGLLARRILQPDRGQDYLTVSGSAGDVLNTLFKRVGLDTLFTASARHAVTIGQYQFDRYTDAYTGIRSMLAANNAKLRLVWQSGKVNAVALPVEHYGDAIDSDLLDFDASQDTQPVNHLIGLGQGDLHDRVVVHWYADTAGNVSQTQTLTGLAERAAVYDYSNAQDGELNEKTKEKLEELQKQGGVSVTLNDRSLSMDVGDTVTGRDNRLGITLTVPITKKIVKVNAGVMSVDYECGTADGVTTSLNGTAESSGGTGATYYADGTSITLSNNTFSAVVTPEKLDTVRALAEEANTTASNASAATAGKIGGITAASPLTAVRDGDQVTLSFTGSTGGDGSGYVLPAATTDTLGGVMVDGTTITVTPEGRISAHASGGDATDIVADPPLAATTTDGVTRLQVGEASTVTPGVMSVDDKLKLDSLENYTLSAATTSTLGGVRPDGSTIAVDADGVISAHVGGMTGMANPWPVGSVYESTTGVDPANDFGGRWEPRPSLGAHTWECVEAGSFGTLPEGGAQPTIVQADSPLTAVMDGNTARVGITPATPDTAGSMSAADKAKLDGLENYTLPAATTDTLGGVMVDGTTITVTDGGVITAHVTGGSGGTTRPTVVTAESPLHADTQNDVVTLTIDAATPTGAGVMGAADKAKLDGLENYTLPAATTSTLGGVRPDGDSVTVDPDGVIHAPRSLEGIWPVGYVVMNTTGGDPADTFGGVWQERPSLGPHLWERIE